VEVIESILLVIKRIICEIYREPIRSSK